jgi:hypothetical protein
MVNVQNYFINFCFFIIIFFYLFIYKSGNSCVSLQTLPLNHAMAKYFLELCLVDYEMCYCAPSLISAAATYLALW